MNNHHNFGDYRVEVINDPGAHIEESSVENLITECTELSRSSFGSPHIRRELIRHHILEQSTTVFGRDHSGKLFGFGSSKIMTIGEFYIIYLQCIANEYKGKGFHKVFLPFRLIEGLKQIKRIDPCVSDKNIFIGAKTQSPITYRTANKVMGLFPNPDGFIDKRISIIARKFVKHIYDDDRSLHHDLRPLTFNDKTFVAKGIYKTADHGTLDNYSLYKSKIPFCHDRETNNYMKENLDWKNGDALILLGYYNNEKVKALLRSNEEMARHHAVAHAAEHRLAV